MSVRLLKKSWWVDVSYKGDRRRIRSPENTRAGALLYEATLRKRLMQGETVDDLSRKPVQQPLFHEFAQTWLEEYVAPNNKFSEQRNRRYVLNGSLIPFFGAMRVGDIKARTIEQYKAKKINDGLKNKTIRNHLTLLNKCLSTAYEWLELEGAPPKIKWPKSAPVAMDFLSFDECELLLSRSRGIDYEMILTALRTGLRQGELKGLQWSSIDWENKSLTVQHSRDDHMKVLVPPKSNRIRHVPLDVDLYEVLYRRKKDTGYVFLDTDQEPFEAKGLSNRLAHVCREAGLRRIGWHTLRHTFASHLVMKGVPLTAAQELMGHASITTTMRYAHLAPSTLRSAIEMLNPRTMLEKDFGQPAGNPWLRSQQRELVEKATLPKAA
jgi:integrase